MPTPIQAPRPTEPPAGTAIREYIHKWTPGQAEAARRLGIDPSTLNRALRGNPRSGEQLTDALVRRIAEVFNVSRDIEREWLSLLEQERREHQ